MTESVPMLKAVPSRDETTRLVDGSTFVPVALKDTYSATIKEYGCPCKIGRSKIDPTILGWIIPEEVSIA